jgi:hypothetical protein
MQIALCVRYCALLISRYSPPQSSQTPSLQLTSRMVGHCVSDPCVLKSDVLFFIVMPRLNYDRWLASNIDRDTKADEHWRQVAEWLGIDDTWKGSYRGISINHNMCATDSLLAQHCHTALWRQCPLYKLGREILSSKTSLSWSRKRPVLVCCIECGILWKQQKVRQISDEDRRHLCSLPIFFFF